MAFCLAVAAETLAAVSVSGISVCVAGTAGVASSYTVDESPRYRTLKYQEGSNTLIGPDERPLLVDETLIQSLHGALYVFTHKAVWACSLPPGLQAAPDGVDTVVELPPTEHWGFVARAECRALNPPKVAYFVAQFCSGDFIRPSAETEQLGNQDNDTSTFRALLQEKNKAHAILSIVQDPSNHNVWVHTPEIAPRRYVYKDKTLLSSEYKDDEWVPMKQPMKLKELNDRIHRTECTGKHYHFIENNCRHFAMAVFDDV